MRKFGDFSELSEQTAKNIGIIIAEIERANIDCSIFYGYPLIELDNTSTIMKCCIISQNGILILNDSEQEQKVYHRHILKTILDCQTISDLVMDSKNKLIQFKDCNNIKDILEELNKDIKILSTQDVDLLVAVIQKA